MLNSDWKILHMSDIDSFKNCNIYISEQTASDGSFAPARIFEGNQADLRALVGKCQKTHRYVIWRPREVIPEPPKKFTILLPCRCVQNPCTCEFEDDGYCKNPDTKDCQYRKIHAELAVF